METGYELQTIRAASDSTGGVFGVAFSPDGKTLAAGSDDAAIHLLTIQPNVPLRQYLRIYQFDGLELTPLSADNLYGGSGFRALTIE